MEPSEVLLAQNYQNAYLGLTSVENLASLLFEEATFSYAFNDKDSIKLKGIDKITHHVRDIFANKTLKAIDHVCFKKQENSNKIEVHMDYLDEKFHFIEIHLLQIGAQTPPKIGFISATVTCRNLSIYSESISKF